MRNRLTIRRARLSAALGFLALAVLVAACGGGASAAGDPVPDSADEPAVVIDTQPAAADDGEYADEEWVAAAVDVLHARDSYTIEVETTYEGSSGPELIRMFGTIRPADRASQVSQEIEGSGSTYITIGTESWIDFGDGRFRPQDETDDTGELARKLWDEFFVDYADDFVVAGTETVHGRSAVHLTIDPYLVERKVEMFGEEWRPWTIDLWLAEDDGHLVRAVYGGPQAPITFTLPRFTIDIKSVDCECPVFEPR